LQYVFHAITLTRHQLQGKVPLIGFSGAPWTLMGYMIEGGGSKTMNDSKSWLYKYPEASHKLLQRITDIVVEYLVGQIKAGAQLLEVFDTNVGELGPDLFTQFAFPYLKQIASRVKQTARNLSLPVPPMTAFPKGILVYVLNNINNIM